MAKVIGYNFRGYGVDCLIFIQDLDEAKKKLKEDFELNNLDNIRICTLYEGEVFDLA